MEKIYHIFQNKRPDKQADDSIKISYQIYRIIIENKPQNNESNGFQEKKLACDQCKPFKIPGTTYAGIEQKGHNIPHHVEEEQCDECKPEFIELQSKQLNIRKMFGDHRYKLREEYCYHHTAHYRDDEPGGSQIAGIFRFLHQKILNIGISLENRQQNNVYKNTPKNTIYHPVIMFRDSDQLQKIFAKIRIRYELSVFLHPF